MLLQPPPAAPAARRQPARQLLGARQRALGAAGAAALLLHAALLWPAAWSFGRPAQAPTLAAQTPSPLRLRSLPLAPALPPAPSPSPPAFSTAAARAVAAQLDPARLALLEHRPARSPGSAPAEAAPLALPAAGAAELLADSDEADAGAPAAAETGPPPPVYRTQVAPAMTLHFARRPLAAADAASPAAPATEFPMPSRAAVVLRWQLPPNASEGLARAYDLQVEVENGPGRPATRWASQGRLVASGLEPERFEESRRQRVQRATNFQPEQRRISFSAQSTQFAWAEGMQDRSSWMLQLGAVLQANPALAEPGAQVTLLVVGTRGAPRPWVFTVVERGPLVVPAGRIEQAVQLLREPSLPYDTRARVWLDASRHHLPVKLQLQLQTGAQGQAQGQGQGQEWALLALEHKPPDPAGR